MADDYGYSAAMEHGELLCTDEEEPEIGSSPQTAIILKDCSPPLEDGSDSKDLIPVYDKMEAMTMMPPVLFTTTCDEYKLSCEYHLLDCTALNDLLGLEIAELCSADVASIQHRMKRVLPDNSRVSLADAYRHKQFLQLLFRQVDVGEIEEMPLFFSK